MDFQESNIIHLQNLTPEITIQDIYKCYTRSGDINKIILGRSEALVFFSNDEEADSAMFYDAIGDVQIEVSLAENNNLNDVIEEENSANEKQKNLSNTKEEQKKLPETKEEQIKLQEQQNIALQQMKQEDDIEIITQSKIENEAKEKSDREALMASLFKSSALPLKEFVSPPTNEREQTRFQVAKNDIQFIKENQEKHVSHSPEKTSIPPTDVLKSKEEVPSHVQQHVEELPSHVEYHVEKVPSHVQQHVEELPSHVEYHVEKVPSHVEQHVEEVPAHAITKHTSPSEQHVEEVIVVQKITEPAIHVIVPEVVSGQLKEEKKIEKTRSEVIQESRIKNLSEHVEEPKKTNEVSCPHIETKYCTRSNATIDACKHAEKQQTQESAKSASSSSSPIDSVQLLKTLKNTSLPERTQPAVDDLFSKVQNPIFIAGLVGLIIALTVFFQLL